MRRPMHAEKKKVSKDAYKKLFKSLKPYVIPILISMIFVITSVVVSIIAPQFLKDLTNEIQAGSTVGNINIDKVWDIAIIMIILYSIYAVTAFLSGYIMTIVTQKYGYNLRKEISNKIPQFTVTQIIDTFAPFHKNLFILLFKSRKILINETFLIF